MYFTLVSSFQSGTWSIGKCYKFCKVAIKYVRNELIFLAETGHKKGLPHSDVDDYLHFQDIGAKIWQIQ